VVPKRAFAESGFAKGTLYRRKPRLHKVDELLLLWRGYGDCLGYVTAKEGNATYVVCGERAPALVGLECELADLSIKCGSDTFPPRIKLRADQLEKLTRSRPLAVDETWRTRDSNDTKLEMLLRAEQIASANR
jgi:hypothetical protein